MHRVVYYLAFIVEGRDRLVVAFPVRACVRAKDAYYRTLRHLH